MFSYMTHYWRQVKHKFLHFDYTKMQLCSSTSLFLLTVIVYVGIVITLVQHALDYQLKDGIIQSTSIKETIVQIDSLGIELRYFLSAQIEIADDQNTSTSSTFCTLDIAKSALNHDALDKMQENYPVASAIKVYVSPRKNKCYKDRGTSPGSNDAAAISLLACFLFIFVSIVLLVSCTATPIAPTH